jgi:hypothetical protein
MYCEPLADNVINDYEPLNFNLPNEDIMITEIKINDTKDEWCIMNSLNVLMNDVGIVIIFQNEI